MSDVKAYRHAVERAIAGLDSLSYRRQLDWCGLSELLDHLRSVANDLKRGQVNRALGEWPYINDKFERFAVAVSGWPIGSAVDELWARFLGAVQNQRGDIQLPRGGSRHSRQRFELGRRELRLTQRQR